jgi:hypothetical protein
MEQGNILTSLERLGLVMGPRVINLWGK